MQFTGIFGVQPRTCPPAQAYRSRSCRLGWAHQRCSEGEKCKGACDWYSFGTLPHLFLQSCKRLLGPLLVLGRRRLPAAAAPAASPAAPAPPLGCRTGGTTADIGAGVRGYFPRCSCAVSEGSLQARVRATWAWQLRCCQCWRPSRQASQSPGQHSSRRTSAGRWCDDV